MSFFTRVIENAAVHFSAGIISRALEHGVDNGTELLAKAKNKLSKLKSKGEDKVDPVEPPIVPPTPGTNKTI